MTIQAVVKESGGTYGSPWMRAELSGFGLLASLNRVSEITRAAGPQGVSRLWGVRTADSDERGQADRRKWVGHSYA